jgi:hypothetical protein
MQAFKTIALIFSALFFSSTLSFSQARPNAGCQAPEYHQFDFWIGDWQVQSPNGKPVGSNRVTSELDGCLLVEHWTSSIAHQLGSSFNYYDVRDKKWHQLYISNSGNAGAFPAMSGQVVDGNMIMLTDDNSGRQSRWTWYLVSPGHVRQMAEQSVDHGKTWKVTWDSIYVSRSAK